MVEHIHVTIRQARIDEETLLSELTIRSKAYWGYSSSELEAWRSLLAITRKVIESELVLCAEVHNHVVGVAHLVPVSSAEVELDHLFVDPQHIGKGIGRQLWNRALEWVRASGAIAVIISSDPHACPFYERVGAGYTGKYETYSAIPNYRAVCMRFDI